MKRLLVSALAIAALTVPSPARASTERAADEDAYRPFTEEAVRLFKAERFEEAAELFRRARDVGGPPIVVFNLARCYQEIGRWEAARDAFQAYLALDDGNEEVRGRADLAVAVIDKRLATGWVLAHVSPVGATVLIDGEPVGEAPLTPFELPPGRHEVTVRAEGHAPWTATVDVTGGERVEVDVELVRAAEPAPAADPAPEPTTFGEPPSFSPWTWVTLGSGVALLTGGTIAYALGEKDHAEIAGADGYGTDEPADMTRVRARDLEASGDRKKLAGYVLWGVGGAAVATSTVLFVLDATRADPPSTVQVGFVPAPAGGLLSVTGRF